MMMIIVRFFEVNPEGKVPVIKVDGKWVADSDVITGSMCSACADWIFILQGVLFFIFSKEFVVVSYGVV